MSELLMDRENILSDVPGFNVDGEPGERSPESLASKLAMVDVVTGSVRLTAAGRQAYRTACASLKVAPERVTTVSQLEEVQRRDAELCLAMVLNGEEMPWDKTS